MVTNFPLGRGTLTGILSRFLLENSGRLTSYPQAVISVGELGPGYIISRFSPHTILSFNFQRHLV